MAHLNMVLFGGSMATAAYRGGIQIGLRARATANNQLVIGDSLDFDIRDVYIGKGVTNATPQAVTIQPTGKSGTNQAGVALNLGGGKSTGSGDGGAINLQVSPAGSSGAALNPLVTAFSISSTFAATFRSTDAGATGPVVTLHHDSASPAAADVCGRISFDGEDATSAQTVYAKIDAVIRDTTNLTEDGDLEMYVMRAGTVTRQLWLDSDVNGAIFGDGAANAIVQSAGNFDLVLRTGNATTGTITLADGASGDLTVLLNGAGKTILDNGTDPVTLQLNGAAGGFNNEIVDLNGNEILALQGVASAVNELTVKNAATATAPTLGVQGDDTNISQRLTFKGTAHVIVDRPVFGNLIAPTSINTAGDTTLTAAQTLGGIIVIDPNGAGRTITFPAAADLVAALPGVAVGDVVVVHVVNGADAAETLTLAVPPSGSFDGNQTAASRVIAQNNSKDVRLRFTNVTATSEAYVLYC